MTAQIQENDYERQWCSAERSEANPGGGHLDQYSPDSKSFRISAAPVVRLSARASFIRAF